MKVTMFSFLLAFSHAMAFGAEAVLIKSKAKPSLMRFKPASSSLLKGEEKSRNERFSSISNDERKRDVERALYFEDLPLGAGGSLAAAASFEYASFPPPAADFSLPGAAMSYPGAAMSFPLGGGEMSFPEAAMSLPVGGEMSLPYTSDGTEKDAVAAEVIVEQGVGGAEKGAVDDKQVDGAIASASDAEHQAGGKAGMVTPVKGVVFGVVGMVAVVILGFIASERAKRRALLDNSAMSASIDYSNSVV